MRPPPIVMQLHIQFDRELTHDERLEAQIDVERAIKKCLGTILPKSEAAPLGWGVALLPASA